MSLSRRTSRSGAATVEMAIALSVFVTLILGVVDLGYGVFRQHVLSHAARQLARQAVVRGKLSDKLPVWGPHEISVTADAGNPVAEFIAPNLVGWNLSEVNVQMKWIDGDHDVRRGSRVRVELTAPYRPVMTFIFGKPSIDLHSSSTMTIAH